MQSGWTKAVLVGALLAATSMIGAARAEAQYFGQNKVQYRTYDWRSIHSDHFEVFFYPGEDSLAMRVLDLAEKTNAVFSKRLRHQLSRTVPIILYGSHNDFSQTNVTSELIDGSTGGFTELLRNRVVIPFTGSYEDLRHVLVHELAHAFQFDILYGSSGASLIASGRFFSLPLWFAEGMAEFYSLGMEPNAEMFVRDGMLTGYVPPIEYAGGYYVYKIGQSTIAYLVEHYGEERFRDLLQRTRQMRSFDRAFQRTYDMPIPKFDEKWREWARKEYWPTIAAHEQPDEFGRRLTDHRKDESNLNTSPSISPQGDRIVYFTDRRQYTDVYVMSAIDGKVQRRLIRGERNVQFETIPSFRSALTWSPDGERIALTAKSAGRDKLYEVRVSDGKVLRTFDLPCEALYYPSWSPVSDSIVVVGVKDGRSDLWLVNATNGQISRLTDDTYDEKEPCWSPDGARLTFASDRLAPVVLHPEPPREGFGRYGLFDLELSTRIVREILDTAGEDHSPAWSPDGRRLAFISDRSGTNNIYLYDRTDSTVTQLTDVLGGVSTISWSRQNDRMVFSAFTRGGFDIFAVKEPLSLDSVVQRLRKSAPLSVLSIAAAREAPVDSSHTPPLQAALAGAWPDSLVAADSTAIALHDSSFTALDDGFTARGRPPLDRLPDEPPSWSGSDFPRRRELPPDTLKVTRVQPERTPLVERGGPFALSDSVLSQAPEGYRWHLAPEYANGGFLAATGYGFVGSTQIVFADFLGDRNVYVAADLYSSALSETNALVIYNYLPKRYDWGAGAFHFKNYFSSRVTTLGEALGSPRQFSEETFGVLGTVSYPFDKFRRVEANFTQMFVNRTFFAQNIFGDYFESGREYRSVTVPSLSLIGDNSLSTYYGPVNGARYNFTVSPAIHVFPKGLSYNTFTLDARRYWDLTHGYTFAARTLAGYSGGHDAQTFRVGGYSTLRGYSDFDLLGTRVAIVNAELRFPFIQQLGLVGPVPLGVFNMRGALFGDAGLVWNEDDRLRFSHLVDGSRRLDSPKVGFGVGIRSFVWIALVKADVGWNTDFHGASHPRWHVSIGPEF